MSLEIVYYLGSFESMSIIIYRYYFYIKHDENK